MGAERLYHLVSFYSSGEKTYCTSYPMTHEKCMVMRSKFSNPTKIILEELGGPVTFSPFKTKANIKAQRTANNSVTNSKKGCWIEGNKIACYGN